MSLSYKRLFCAALLTLTSAMALADDRAYTNGPVVAVNYIRTKPGMFDTYMAWLGGERKKEMEAYKKAGIILSYSVYSVQPRSPQEADVILTITYKNWATLDGLTEKTDVIDKQIFGSMDNANKASISRESMREVLGSDTIQELLFK